MINRWFLELRRAAIGGCRVFVYFGNFRNYFKFVKESKGERDEGLPCRRSLGVSADRQGAGDTTGREHFEDSASV